LIPLTILVVASWATGTRPTRSRLMSPIFLGVVVAFLAGGIVSLYGIMSTPRSNAREVALSINQAAEPNDLLILAPEWYAASFNRYSLNPAEQIDYPYSGKSRITDFADVWERVTNAAPLADMETRIIQARKSNRRVWFVSERHYLGRISRETIARAISLRQPAPFSVLRVNQIRDLLEREYGAPESTISIGGPKPRYDDVRAYLFSPH
jgi:hypothetical protein